MKKRLGERNHRCQKVRRKKLRQELAVVLDLTSSTKAGNLPFYSMKTSQRTTEAKRKKRYIN